MAATPRKTPDKKGAKKGSRKSTGGGRTRRGPDPDVDEVEEIDETADDTVVAEPPTPPAREARKHPRELGIPVRNRHYADVPETVRTVVFGGTVAKSHKRQRTDPDEEGPNPPSPPPAPARGLDWSKIGPFLGLGLLVLIGLLLWSMFGKSEKQPVAPPPVAVPSATASPSPGADSHEESAKDKGKKKGKKSSKAEEEEAEEADSESDEEEDPHDIAGREDDDDDDGAEYQSGGKTIRVKNGRISGEMEISEDDAGAILMMRKIPKSAPLPEVMITPDPTPAPAPTATPTPEPATDGISEDVQTVLGEMKGVKDELKKLKRQVARGSDSSSSQARADPPCSNCGNGGPGCGRCRTTPQATQTPAPVAPSGHIHGWGCLEFESTGNRVRPGKPRGKKNREHLDGYRIVCSVPSVWLCHHFGEAEFHSDGSWIWRTTCARDTFRRVAIAIERAGVAMSIGSIIGALVGGGGGGAGPAGPAGAPGIPGGQGPGGPIGPAGPPGTFTGQGGG